MITIYLQDRPVHLISDINNVPENIKQKQDTAFYVNPTEKTLKDLIADIHNGIGGDSVLVSNNIEKLQKKFFKQFKNIEAAGGIVQNADKELLFIFRRGKWDLPKGKLDKGESLETCAKREVEEETGASNLVLKKKIGETYHTYFVKGKEVLKTTHWYYFIASGKQQLVPQIEEDITEIKWFSTKEIRTPVANTYPNIKAILSEFFDTP